MQLNTRLLFSGSILSLLLLAELPSISWAVEEEFRPDHYKVVVPANQQEALSSLQSKTNEIAVILKKAKLDDKDLETIHEKSYWLEASVDALRQVDVKEEVAVAVDNLDEAVQALHYASENHRETQTREWFGKLKTAAEQVSKSF